MPKGRLEYLKRLLPFLQNQSEDCLYLNVFSPLHGKPEHFLQYIVCPVLLYSLPSFFSSSFCVSSGCTRKEIAGTRLHTR